MIHLEGLKKVEKIPWNDIQPGMIFLGGIRINDTVPFELRDFPVLSPSLLEELTKKYYFLSNRDILVLKAKTGYSPSKLSKNLMEARENISSLNKFRLAFYNEKEKIHKISGHHLNTLFMNTDFVEEQYLITDTYNSFNVPHPIPDATGFPSLFHSLNTQITLGHLLTNKLLSQFNLLYDEEVLLHLVVGISPTITADGNFDIVSTALDFFDKLHSDVLKNTEIKHYVFSGQCKPVHYPLSGREIQRNGTHFSSFVKKVLHFKDTTRHNKVILFTDSKPADMADALHYGRLFKKNNIDFTQIIFNTRDEEQADDQPNEHIDLIFREFTQFVETCGGNQIIVTKNDFIPAMAMEVYDRYLGYLTLLDPAYAQPNSTDNVQHDGKVIQKDPVVYKNGKVVKRWKPRTIRRPG